MQWMLFSVSTERCERGKMINSALLSSVICSYSVFSTFRHLTSLAQWESFPPNKPLMDWKENNWIKENCFLVPSFPRSLTGCFLLFLVQFLVSFYSLSAPQALEFSLLFLFFPTSLILLVSCHPSLSAPFLLVIPFLCFHFSPFLPLLYFALYLFFPPIDEFITLTYFLGIINIKSPLVFHHLFVASISLFLPKTSSSFCFSFIITRHLSPLHAHFPFHQILSFINLTYSPLSPHPLSLHTSLHHLLIYNEETWMEWVPFS